MRMFVAYDKSGRVTAVGVPNPELAGELVMEAPAGDSIVAVETSEVLKNAERLTFATSGDRSDRLQELVRTIVERHRVDPASRRLVSKEPAKG